MVKEIERPRDLKPDTTSINTVLNMLSIHDCATRTEQKLWEFFDAHIKEPQRKPCPDNIAFSTAINAWSNSTDPSAPDRADMLLQKLVKLYQSEKKKKSQARHRNLYKCYAVLDQIEETGSPRKSRNHFEGITTHGP